MPNPAEQILQGLSMKEALASTQQRQAQTQLEQQQTQAAQMENQQRQMDLQDQKTWRQAYTDSGGDLDKAFDLASQRGVGPKTLMPIRQAVLQAAEARAKLSVSQSQAEDAKHDRINALLQPVFQETDPQKQQALWNQQSQQAVQQGIMTPQEAAQHPYPGPAGVQDYAHSLVTNKWITAQAARTRAQAAADQAKNAADKAKGAQPEQDAKTQTAIRANLAPILATAADSSKEDYARAYYKADPVAAGSFPHPDTYDPQKTPAAVRNLGMTADQQVTTARAAAAQAQTKAHQGAEEAHWTAEEGRAKGQLTSAFLQKEADKHDALQSQEQQQWQIHGALGDVLKSVKDGDSFLDPTTKSGVPIPMDNATRARIKAEYDQSATKAVGLQNQQKGMRKRYGWGEFAQPSATTPAAPAPPQNQPPPTQKPPATTPVKFTEAQVRQRATAAGKDPEAAVTAARAKQLIQ